jgi:hypothetical protein
MINQIAQDLQQMQEFYGHDALFEQCEEVYSGMYRSEAVSIAAYASEWNVPVEQIMREVESSHPETLIVDLCNYKGEGEGLALFDDKTKNLSIFVSKYNYL